MKKELNYNLELAMALRGKTMRDVFPPVLHSGKRFASDHMEAIFSTIALDFKDSIRFASQPMIMERWELLKKHTDVAIAYYQFKKAMSKLSTSEKYLKKQ